MSLVERALKKLQESGRPAAGSPSAPLTRPVEPAPTPTVPVIPTLTAPGTPAPRPSVVVPPSRVIHVDREALRAMKLYPPADMERQIASQYRRIKRPLVAAMLAQDASAAANRHLVMLASALPGEGKTFTSLNLALSLALEKDLEVLLIDADVAKPHVSRIFGIEREPGLLDLLTDGTLHSDSVILRTDVPGLSLMSAGRQIDTATELLASQRMREVVQQLGSTGRRRIVLFDSPPLLLSTESRALVPNVGQVALVVRAESTPQNAVLSAIEAVGEGRPVSLILNQSSVAPGEGYYGYGPYGSSGSPSSSSST